MASSDSHICLQSKLPRKPRGTTQAVFFHMNFQNHFFLQFLGFFWSDQSVLRWLTIQNHILMAMSHLLWLIMQESWSCNFLSQIFWLEKISTKPSDSNPENFQNSKILGRYPWFLWGKNFHKAVWVVPPKLDFWRICGKNFHNLPIRVNKYNLGQPIFYCWTNTYCYVRWPFGVQERGWQQRKWCWIS